MVDGGRRPGQRRSIEKVEIYVVFPVRVERIFGGVDER